MLPLAVLSHCSTLTLSTSSSLQHNMTPDAAIRILQDPEVAAPSMFPFKYHSSEKSPDSDTCPDSLNHSLRSKN